MNIHIKTIFKSPSNIRRFSRFRINTMKFYIKKLKIRIDFFAFDNFVNCVFIYRICYIQTDVIRKRFITRRFYRNISYVPILSFVSNNHRSYFRCFFVHKDKRYAVAVIKINHQFRFPVKCFGCLNDPFTFRFCDKQSVFINRCHFIDPHNKTISGFIFRKACHEENVLQRI